MTQPSQPLPYFPIIETERLILRQLTFDDTDFIFQHFSDPNVSQYLMDELPLTDRAGAEEIIRFYLEPEGKTYNRWGMVHKTDHRLIGTIGFHKWSKTNLRAEIGYDLSPAWWGKGYMSEALGAVLRNGFERMGLNRIEALVYTGNARSNHLLERFGFNQEGLLREYYGLNGTFNDHYLYALLRKDWKP
jgi:[ribosomal protein S5]-alanine N-acetyltransferase